jgi:predicted protein tyrosine phosphatase
MHVGHHQPIVITVVRHCIEGFSRSCASFLCAAKSTIVIPSSGTSTPHHTVIHASRRVTVPLIVPRTKTTTGDTS